MTTERAFEHIDNAILLHGRQKKHKCQQMFSKTAKRSHKQPKQAKIYSHNCCLANRYIRSRTGWHVQSEFFCFSHCIDTTNERMTDTTNGRKSTGFMGAMDGTEQGFELHRPGAVSTPSTTLNPDYCPTYLLYIIYK